MSKISFSEPKECPHLQQYMLNFKVILSKLSPTTPTSWLTLLLGLGKIRVNQKLNRSVDKKVLRILVSEVISVL